MGAITLKTESPYLCPECRAGVDGETLQCPRGHRFHVEDGVLVLVADPLLARLRSFMETLEKFRDHLGRRLLDESVYDRLPYGEAQRGDFEWRLRCFDLRHIRRLLGTRRGRVLDVGCHNGWLCRNLSDDGHDVTGVDFFSDPYDGLRARRFFTDPRWRSIQMDLCDLSILNQRYDVVVLNRCLQFFPDPLSYLKHAKERVAPAGLLILTGLDFYRDPRAKKRLIARVEDDYRARYGTDFFLHPTRGYLDFEDRRRFIDAGVHIHAYPEHRLRNWKARILRNRPWFAFGWWRA